MNLFIIKKVIAIYKLNSFVFLFALISLKEATSQDMVSYCFDKTVRLGTVYQSLNIIVLPKDIIDQRIEDNCLDVITSPEREKLFEKYLSKRYDFKKDPRGEMKNNSSENLECRLDLRTTKKFKTESSNFKLGEKNTLNSTVISNDSVSTMEILLGAGRPGEFEAGEERLKVTCQLSGRDSANLTFSYAEKNKANVNAQLFLKRGEWSNIASVIKDLTEKSRTIGIPQTEIGQLNGKVETVYELQFK
jgi:hypothetical protein